MKFDRLPVAKPVEDDAHQMVEAILILSEAGVDVRRPVQRKQASGRASGQQQVPSKHQLKVAPDVSYYPFNTSHLR